MEIDSDAPVIATSSEDISAAPETVWDLLAGIERWPAWNPDIKFARLVGDLKPGMRFRWKAGPGTITSTLVSVDRPREIGWTGRTLGIRAVHVWRIEPLTTGCRVYTEESWDGLPARLLRGPMRKMLQKAVSTGLRHLKAAAESV